MSFMVTSFGFGPMVLALDFDGRRPAFRGPALSATVFSSLDEIKAAIAEMGAGWHDGADNKVVVNATVWNLEENKAHGSLLDVCGAEAFAPVAPVPTEAEEEAALCEAGHCDHYTCTEGRSIDEWDEPEPTRWDYESEAFGPTARDAEDFCDSEGA